MIPKVKVSLYLDLLTLICLRFYVSTMLFNSFDLEDDLTMSHYRSSETSVLKTRRNLYSM